MVRSIEVSPSRGREFGRSYLLGHVWPENPAPPRRRSPFQGTASRSITGGVEGTAGFLACSCPLGDGMGMLRRHQHTSAGHTVAAMYRDHATAAFRYAVHVTGSQHDAEDLVQAAFLEAHRYLVGGGAIVNPRAWLATVVRTRAINLRRDHRDEAASDQLELLASPLGEEPSDARDALDRVRAVLYELPEAQHQAFVLRY